MLDNFVNTFINFRERMEPFIQQIFVLCFRRLTSSKTTKFIKSTIPKHLSNKNNTN